MPDIIDPAERIQAILDAADPRIARIFASSINQLRNNLDLNEIAELLEQGRTEEVLQQIQGTAETLGSASQIVFVTAGQSAAQFLTAADLGLIAFNAVNTRAVDAMQRNTLSLISGFTQEQRNTVSQVMLDGIIQGLNPRDQARNFRDVVGLTPTQAQAVLNYRRLLSQAGMSDLTRSEQREALSRELRDGRYDKTIERAVREGRPLSPEQIDTMVQRYSERYVKYRAEVIGRTEALRAVHQGNQEAYAQAISAGKFLADDIERKWVTRLDGRERESHRELNDVVRPWGQTFPGLAGPLMYPGDPDAPVEETAQCRCCLATRLKLKR